MGFDSPEPRSTIPYSVSMPHTLAIAISSTLQVLPCRDAFDGAAAGGVLAVGDQRAHVDDALALLARDLLPVVRVGGVGEVLVLLELLLDRRQKIVDSDALALAGDRALDRQLLGPPDDVLDHCPLGEVLEGQY